MVVCVLCYIIYLLHDCHGVFEPALILSTLAYTHCGLCKTTVKVVLVSHNFMIYYPEALSTRGYEHAWPPVSRHWLVNESKLSEHFEEFLAHIQCIQ